MQVFAPFDIGGCDSDVSDSTQQVLSVCSVSIEETGHNYRFIEKETANITKSQTADDHIVYSLNNIVNTGKSMSCLLIKILWSPLHKPTRMHSIWLFFGWFIRLLDRLPYNLG